MFLSIGTALALIPLGVYAYRDLSLKFGIPFKIDLPEKPHPKWIVPIGVDEERSELVLDFSKTPHVCLGGGTRFGKSNLLNSIIVSLTRNSPEDVTFTLIDLKGGLEFGAYESMTQVVSIAYEPEEALVSLSNVYTQMRLVQEKLRSKGLRKTSEKKHFIIIDEVGELNPSEAVDSEEKKLKRACQAYMSKISRLGAGLGFNLILATQYPTGDVLPRQCKQNSDAKICFRVQSSVASKVVLDEVGAEELPTVKGRALFQRGVERYTVQVYRVSEQQIRNTIQQNKRNTLLREVLHHEEAPERATRENTFILEETLFSNEDTTIEDQLFREDEEHK